MELIFVTFSIFRMTFSKALPHWKWEESIGAGANSQLPTCPASPHTSLSPSSFIYGAEQFTERVNEITAEVQTGGIVSVFIPVLLFLLRDT